MPLIKEHMESSMKRTGKTYQELHEWMDIWKDNYVEAKARHDIMNIPANIAYARRKWGDEGSLEFLHHLKDDTENYKRSFFYKAHKVLFSVKRKLKMKRN